MSAGRLILVVGPSGAGKDTLLGFARDTLRGRDDIVFARRVITRPADATEDHEAVSEAEFSSRDYLLSWQAHGLSYGIPAACEADLAAGRTVVANVSRRIIPAARARFNCVVVEITAPPAVLAARLAARGRESAADIEARLARQVGASEADVVLVNDEPVETGGKRFVDALLF